MFENFKPPNKVELTKFKKLISNWTKTAQLIYSTEDPDLVRFALYVEGKCYNREYNRKRLYQRFSKLRRKKELHGIKDLVKDIESYPEGISILSNQYKLSFFLSDKVLSLTDILGLIKVELETLKRPYIIHKLYGRFHVMRQIEEVKTNGIIGKRKGHREILS